VRNEKREAKKPNGKFLPEARSQLLEAREFKVLSFKFLRKKRESRNETKGLMANSCQLPGARG